ncbi:MAG: NUDIX domain-containing protein [Deltaproteobacteria bacterium]|nr:MAG: NUDIX domain-containing protein [Deltaproteobacteria bacterium]
MKRIRPLALALISNDKNQYFFHEGSDSVKNETFYRPLGGGIEFGEQGADALKREFLEEINQEIAIGPLLNVYENIFTFEGKEGHEIVLLFKAHFLNEECYHKTFDILEGNKVVGRAVWKSIEDIQKAGSKIYPLGIEDLLEEKNDE